MKRYMAVIFLVWALAYSLFLFASARVGKSDGEGISSTRQAPARENFDFRFINYTKKTSVNIELSDQRKVKDSDTGQVFVEDVATSLYKQRKGPFPRNSEEFRIDPSYLQGMPDANLNTSFTLLTRKGQYTLAPEGLYYMSRGCGTEFVMMRLKPKKARSFPELQEDRAVSVPADLFVLKQPHPPIRKMEVYTPEALPMPPEILKLVKEQLPQTFKKIRGSQAYSRSSVKPPPDPNLTYLKFPPVTGVKLVAAVWSTRGGKGYSASALFQVQEERDRTKLVKVVDIDPSNASVLKSTVRVLVINDSMFAFVLDEGKSSSRQEKVYMIPREGGPWQLRGTSVYRSETC